MGHFSQASSTARNLALFPSVLSNTIMPQLTTLLALETTARDTLFSLLWTLYRNFTSPRQHLRLIYLNTQKRSNNQSQCLCMHRLAKFLQQRIQAHLKGQCRYVILQALWMWIPELTFITVDCGRSWLRDLPRVLSRIVQPRQYQEWLVSERIECVGLYRTWHRSRT